MIYYLPERIYGMLKDEPDIMNPMKEIESKFDGYDNLKSYISGYSRLAWDNETKKMYIRLNDKIRNTLAPIKELQLEFDINNGDFTLQAMKYLYNFGTPEEGVDTENRFFLISNIINQLGNLNEYMMWITRYVDLYESLSEEVRTTLSKYIHLKYMYAYIYKVSYNWYNFGIDGWEDVYLNIVFQLRDRINDIVKDKDIVYNYFIEALTDGVRLLNWNQEKNELFKTAWLGKFVNAYHSKFDEFQYSQYSSGTLMFLDTIATIYCLNGEKDKFASVFALLLVAIEKSLEDYPKLLRGLSYYDKVNHNMYALLLRKVVKILSGLPQYSVDIKSLLKPEDYEYIMSDDIGIVSAASPNSLQEMRTKEDFDKAAEAMVNKFLEIN